VDLEVNAIVERENTSVLGTRRAAKRRKETAVDRIIWRGLQRIQNEVENEKAV
jgi:hypothetical protein